MNIAQETEDKTLYKYFAFISYSSADVRWGKLLQRSLEHYRLPARLRKEHPDTPKRAYPIFRDETNLAGFKVWDSLAKELDNSRYLIVLCSPNSAASGWVNNEVRYFIEQGKEDHILPLIIDGVPYAADPARECFPPALRELKDRPLGVSVRQLGWRGAYLKMISTLLHVDYDELAMRDKHRRVKNGILRTVAGIAAAAGLGTLWWYNTEHVKYFNAYTLRYEKPVGIYEMSKKERTHASECYRFTTLRGKVIRVETVNSYGVVIDPGMKHAFTDYPVLEYLYDDDGELITVIQKDAAGKEISRKILTANPATNEIAVDFRSPSNSLNAQALSADMADYVIGEQRGTFKSEITRMRNTYDEKGYLIRSVYQRDNLGTPACDSNGVYGKAYVYDRRGQILRVQNLDEKGQVFNCKSGWAYEEYAYDAAGNPILSECFDADGNRARGSTGYYICRVTYDAYGNPLRLQALDEAGQPFCTAEGYAAQVYQYDDAGLLISYKYLDENNMPVYGTDFCHEVRLDHDASGRVSAIHLFDTGGQPVYAGEVGFSTMLYTLDENGRVVEERYLDTRGEPAVGKETGVCGFRFTYDENGYVREMTALGENWTPAVRKQGHVTEYCVYNGDGQLLRLEYRDASGRLTRTNYNIAVAVYTYDGFGNQTGVSYFDEQEKPCYCVEGYASAEYGYQSGNMVSKKYFGTDGLPVVNNGHYHAVNMDYNEKGNCVRFSYYDIQGARRAGYAVCELRYDSFGNITAQYYLDAEGQPICDRDTGAYGTRWYYDKNGHQQRVEYLDMQGNLAENGSGYAAVEYVYDSVGRKIREAYFDPQGNPVRCGSGCAAVTYGYDPMGNIIETRAFDEKGDPCSQSGGYSVKQTIFEDGKAVSERYYDASGAPVMADAGYHECRVDYDEKGNSVRRSFYDRQGILTNNAEGYAVIEQSYDAYGNVTVKAYYSADGEPAYNLDIYKYEYGYDIRGNEIREVRHTLHPQEQAYIIAEVEYDTLGQPVVFRFLDEKGDPVTADRYFCSVKLEYDKHGNFVRNESALDNGDVYIFLYDYDDFGNRVSNGVYKRDSSGKTVRVQ